MKSRYSILMMLIIFGMSFSAFGQFPFINMEVTRVTHESDPNNILFKFVSLQNIESDDLGGGGWSNSTICLSWPKTMLGTCLTNIVQSFTFINANGNIFFDPNNTVITHQGEYSNFCYCTVDWNLGLPLPLDLTIGQQLNVVRLKIINDPLVNYALISPVKFGNEPPGAPFFASFIVDGVGNDYFNEFSLIALPITLSEFKAAWNNGGWVDLKWTTVSEIGSDKFLVERSKDGRKWETIGNESARGAQDIRMDYFLKDYNPHAGINYYRLKMFDLDGSYKYSPIAAVMIEKEGLQAKLYPNPATDYAIIDLDAGLQLEEITLYNIQGKLIKHQTFSTASQYRIELANLAHGEYFLEMILSDKQIFTKKLILNGTGN